MEKRFGGENGESELPYIISCTNEALVNASSLVSFLTQYINIYKLNDKYMSPY